MLATPFFEGDVDQAGLRSTVEHVLAAGVTGIALGGLASEAHTLSDGERKSVAEVVLDAVAGRAPVLVTVTAESTSTALELARHAEASGADAVMVAPPSVTRAGPTALEEHYGVIAASTTIPLMIQDAPAYVGVSLGAGLVARLAERWPNILYLKLEAVPLAPAIAAVKEAAPGRLEIFSGGGGLHLLGAYRDGAAGVIPGCDVPEVFAAIDVAVQGGDWKEATRLFHAALPLLVLQNQSLDVFVAATKRILFERGVIREPAMRAPGGVAASMTDPVVAAFEALVESLPEVFADRGADATPLPNPHK